VDVERALCSRALRTQSLEAVHSRQIQAHHFVQRVKGDTSPIPMPGEVFAWIMEHQRKYNAVPSMDLARARFPLFEFIEVTDPLDVVLDEFLRQVARRELISAARGIAEQIDAYAGWPADFDPVEFMFEVSSGFARALPNDSITRYSDSLDRLALYRQREETGDTPGITFADADLDALTYGAQPNDLVVIEGFLGLGKSSLAIMQCAIEYFERGRTPFFKSLEMDGDKLAARWDAYAAGFQYRALKRLQLGEGDLAKWEKMGEKAADSRFDRDILVDDSDRRPTVEKLYADIQKWRPDFTIVDTLDELRAPSQYRSHWEQQDWIARELKGVARSTKKTIIGIAQAGRDAETEGATLGNVAGSITIPRKADIVIGLHATPQMKKMHQIEFRLLKNRDDEGEGAKLTRYWNKGKMELRPWTPADAVAVRS
jgi:replicative DNA helicase